MVRAPDTVVEKKQPYRFGRPLAQLRREIDRFLVAPI
jgi:hypothetical protein